MRHIRTAALIATSATLALSQAARAQTPPRDTLRRICNALVPQTCTPSLARDSAADGRPYFEFQVEKPATQKPGSPKPRYPDVLRSTGLAGEVVAQFVVDTSGAIETSSLKFLKSSHKLFSKAVRDAAPLMEFEPATIRGRRVRQLVQLPFAFAVPETGGRARNQRYSP
jgi:TonB family protein